MTRDELSLTRLVEVLKERGVDVTSSKLQYYKDLKIIKPVSEFAQFNTYSLKEVLAALKIVAAGKKKGLTLKQIADNVAWAD